MNVTRRDAIRTFTALAAASAIPMPLALAARHAVHAQGELTIAELKTGYWLIQEGGGNTLLIDSTDGPILVDTKVAVLGRALRRKAGEALNAPPSFVINTHHHPDHIGGNFAFPEAKFIGHRNMWTRVPDMLEGRIRPALEKQVEELRANDEGAANTLAARLEDLSARDFAPHTIVDDGYEETIGGVRIGLDHIGKGHTDNDLIVHLPKADIVHAGDLLFHELHPYCDHGSGADTKGWQRSLDAAIAKCGANTIVIPGHGAVTDVDGLRAQRAYFDGMREAVVAARKQGMGRDAVVGLAPEAFADYGFERMQATVLGSIFDELELEATG